MKNLLAHTLLLTLVLSGCTPSPLDYNNLVVTQVNESSASIEESATHYNALIPDVVTEQDEIDTSTMEDLLQTMQSELNDVSDLLELESRDEDQIISVRDEALPVYIEAANNYITAYDSIMVYYQSGEYQEDITKVVDLDEELHTYYTTFIEANNDLVTTLESFVKEE